MLADFLSVVSPEGPIVLIGTVLLALVSCTWALWWTKACEVADTLPRLPREFIDRVQDEDGYPWSPMSWWRGTWTTLVFAFSDMLHDWDARYVYPIGLKGLSAIAASGAVFLVGWRFLGPIVLGRSAPGVWLPTVAWVVIVLAVVHSKAMRFVAVQFD